MSDFIEDFYYGNIDPQECTTNLTAKVKKSLSELVSKEEHLTSLLADKKQELFTDYVPTSSFQASVMQTASPPASDLEQDLHTTLLSIARKDENYGKHNIQKSQ